MRYFQNGPRAYVQMSTASSTDIDKDDIVRSYKDVI